MLRGRSEPFARVALHVADMQKVAANYDKLIDDQKTWYTVTLSPSQTSTHW